MLLLANLKERWILLADSQFGAFFLALATRCSIAHLKCVGSCSLRIQNITGASLSVSRRKVQN
jgi:hypothetical protein